MKLWIYIYFSAITNTVETGKPLKTPYIWDEVSPGADYEEETDEAIKLVQIMEPYGKREGDGLNYFRLVRAKIVLMYYNGTLTMADIYGLEDILHETNSMLVLGDWLSAKNKLTTVTVAPPLTQALYDEIMTEFNNYIAANY